MHKDEPFIRANIPSLLLTKQVKEKTGELGGNWKLHEDEIHFIHPMPNNIEFGLMLINESAACLNVLAKINRKTARLSSIEVNVI